MAQSITWHRTAINPTELVFQDWIVDGATRGTVIAKRDADGMLYGCRDVMFGPFYAECIAAWIRHECDAKGLELVDERSEPKRISL